MSLFKKMKQLLLFLAVLSVSLTACKKDKIAAEKSGSLKGVVKNPAGQPIPGASIQIESFSTTSAADGSYTFTGLPVKNYSVSASKALFVSNTQTVNITANMASTLNFVLTSTSAPLQLTSYEGIIGNLDKGIQDSVYLHFNNAIQSITIKSNIDYCQSALNYNYTNNSTNVMFSFGCAALGGNYPFTITATDQNGNSFSKDINVPFYKSKLNVPGFISDYVLINNEKEVLIATFAPDKLIRYSVEKDSVLQTYDLSAYMSPIKLSYSPYDSKVYIMGTSPGATYRYSYMTLPDIYTLNLQSGQIVKSITIPADPNELYPVNIPFNIAFTKNGHGELLLRSNISSALRWRFIDATQNYLVSTPAGAIGDGDYYDNLQLNYDQTKIISTQTYVGSCVYGVFDGNTQQLTTIKPGSVTRSVFITPNRKNGTIYFGQLYDQFIMDLQGNMSQISGIDNRSNGTADFSYRPNENDVIYFCDDSYLQVLNYSNASTIMNTGVITGLRKFTSTVDGNSAIAYQLSNTDVSSSLFIFDTGSFYRNRK